MEYENKYLEKLIIKENGIEPIDAIFEKYDICWAYHISKQYRDKHPLGSWKTKEEKNLIKAWHQKSLVMIDKTNFQRFPYMCSFSHYTIRDASYGAWTYENFLEFLCKGTKEMYAELIKKSKG